MPTILLVDDEPLIQKLVTADLVSKGYKVVATPDGEQALQMVKQEKPDLLLLDVKIPRISGWDILAAIKTDNEVCHTPVLIMTGALLPGDEEKAHGMGATGCLAKPFTPRELLARIKLALGETV